MIDPQYPPGIALPTSATRLHQANWPSWGDGQGPPMGQMPHITYHQLPGPHPIYYQPSPYYRPNAGMLPLHMQPPHQAPINPELVSRSQGMQNGIAPTNEHAPTTDNKGSRPESATRGGVVDPRLSRPEGGLNQQETANSAPRASDAQAMVQSYPSAPVIDPSLDATTSASVGGEDLGENIGGMASEDIALSLKITQAAVEAVLESVRRESVEAAARVSPAPNGLNVQHPNGMHGNGSQSNNPDVRREPLVVEPGGGVDIEADGDGELEDERNIINELTISQGFHRPLDLSRPEPMEHILTEDGEPMLNPGLSHSIHLCVS
jgi:hypothetical protein